MPRVRSARNKDEVIHHQRSGEDNVGSIDLRQLALVVAARDLGALDRRWFRAEQACATTRQMRGEPIAIDVDAIDVVAGAPRTGFFCSNEKCVPLATGAAVASLVLTHRRTDAHIEAELATGWKCIRHAFDGQRAETDRCCCGGIGHFRRMTALCGFIGRRIPKEMHRAARPFDQPKRLWRMRAEYSEQKCVPSITVIGTTAGEFFARDPGGEPKGVWIEAKHVQGIDAHAAASVRTGNAARGRSMRCSTLSPAWTPEIQLRSSVRWMARSF